MRNIPKHDDDVLDWRISFSFLKYISSFIKKKQLVPSLKRKVLLFARVRYNLQAHRPELSLQLTETKQRLKNPFLRHFRSQIYAVVLMGSFVASVRDLM